MSRGGEVPLTQSKDLGDINKAIYNPPLIPL
jgi:hypothetical protein